MASSTEVLAPDPPLSPDLDDSKDGGKKKRFFKLKNIKQLFTRKKRSKSKDGEVKALSVANVSAVAADRDDTTDDELDHPFSGSTSGALSVSHDSVFSPEKPKDPNISDLARSMERLPQVKGVAFKSELASKLQKRGKKDPSYKDDALPESPVNRNTAVEVLMENGLRSHVDRSYESDHSLISMGDSSDNELEEDFFREKWASSSSLSKRTASPDPGSGSDLDLDIITSTASLNVSAAKHKIAIKQRGKRASAMVLNRRKQNSPKPTVGSMQTLPDVQEEVVPKSSLEKEPTSTKTDEQVTSTASLDSVASSGNKTLVPQIEEPLPDYDSDDKNQTKIDLKPSPRLSTKKPQIKGPKPRLTKAAEQSSIELSEKSGVSGTRVRTTSSSADPSADSPLEFTKIILKKTSSTEKANIISANEESKTSEEKPKQVKTSDGKAKLVISEDKKSQEEKESKVESSTSSVVMRQKSVTQESSKRQTIAIDSTALGEATPFGERKINKRSSWVDSNNRNWEELKNDVNKNKDEKGDGEKNEFAQMFNKFQRKVSQKKEVNMPVKVAKTELSKDAKSGANTSPQSVPSDNSSASTTSQVSSTSNKNVTKPIGTASEVSTDNTTTKVKTSSFIIKSSPGVQNSESKPQPKSVVIEKPKLPDSPKLPQQSSISSPEKKSGDFFPKKTVVIESKSTVSPPAKEIKSTIPTTSSVVTSSSSTSAITSSSVVKDSPIEKSKTTFVFNKSTTFSSVNNKNEQNTKTENDENTQPKTDFKSSSVIYRRPSPVLKDRARSQTLPEQPVLTQKAANLNSSPSQSSDKTNTKVTSSPTASPQRSKSMMKTTKTGLEEKSDGKPSWVAMAKRKTVGWNSEDGGNQDDTKEVTKQQVKTETTAMDKKLASDADSKKSIKDLMRKFQS